ncbi:MAG: hypothetical protein ACXAC5_03880 [Promethearchaeota archaeon]
MIVTTGSRWTKMNAMSLRKNSEKPVESGSATVNVLPSRLIQKQEKLQSWKLNDYLPTFNYRFFLVVGMWVYIIVVPILFYIFW